LLVPLIFLLYPWFEYLELLQITPNIPIRLRQGMAILWLFRIRVGRKVADDQLGVPERQEISLLVIALVLIDLCLRKF